MIRIALFVVCFLAHSIAPYQSLSYQTDCLASSTPPSYYEGESVPCSTDLNGYSMISMGTLGPGETATAQSLGQIYASDSGFPIRYNTTGDKNVKATFGEIVQVSAASGTNVTVAFYDDADGTCSSNQVLGTTQLTNGVPFKFPARFAVGICMVVGGTSPDLTVVYK